MTGSTATPIRRSRPVYVLALALVIATGLLWRSGWIALPYFLSKYGGDSLWALAVFVGFGFLSPTATTVRIGLTALGFAWTIEFLQLYHGDWIERIRATLPGRLILGTTFHSPDLLAYVVGIALGMLAEHATLKPRPIPNRTASP